MSDINSEENNINITPYKEEIDDAKSNSQDENQNLLVIDPEKYNHTELSDLQLKSNLQKQVKFFPNNIDSTCFLNNLNLQKK